MREKQLNDPINKLSERINNITKKVYNINLVDTKLLNITKDLKTPE
jgi:hypothetical protein